MFASRIVALAALTALGACAAAPDPGRPAPTGVTASQGGGTQIVDPLKGAGAPSEVGRPNPSPYVR